MGRTARRTPRKRLLRPTPEEPFLLRTAELLDDEQKVSALDLFDRAYGEP